LSQTKQILRLPVAGGESSSQFSNHDQRKKNASGAAHDFHAARFAFQKAAVRVCVERDVHLLPSFGVDLLKHSDRSIEPRIIPPCANEGIQIMVLDHRRALTTTMMLGQPRSQPHHLGVRQAFYGMLNLINGAHDGNNAQTSTGFKSPFRGKP
jgi:hypothetical protein